MAVRQSDGQTSEVRLVRREAPEIFDRNVRVAVWLLDVRQSDVRSQTGTGAKRQISLTSEVSKSDVS